MADGPVETWPWYLVAGVASALRTLSWLEHLPEEDQPPRAIWAHEHELDLWFKELKRKRKNPTPMESVPEGQVVEYDLEEELAQLRAP